MIILSTLACYIIYLLAKEIFDQKTGLISAFLWTIYIPGIYYSAFLLTETPGMLFLTMSLLFLIKSYNKPSSINIFFAALFFLLLAYSRSIFVLLPLFLCLWFFFIPGKTFIWAIKKSLTLILIFILLSLPWSIRNYNIFHSYVPVTTRAGFSLLQGNHKYSTGVHHVHDYRNFNEKIYPEYIDYSLNEVEQDKVYQKVAVNNIIEKPLGFVKRMGIKFYQFWKIVSPRVGIGKNIMSIISYGFVLVLGIIGLFLSFRKYRNYILLILMVFLYTSLIHMVFFATVRYRFPLEPIFIILSAYFLSEKINIRFLKRLNIINE